jgi:hypothetical protein
VVLDQKIMLFCQSLFCFLNQLQLFLDKIPVVHDLAALGADEVMVMVFLIFAFQFIAALAVAGGDFLNKPEPVEKLQRPVDRRQADPGIHRIQRGIEFLCTHVSGRTTQEVKNDFTGQSPARNVFPKTVLPMMSSGQLIAPYR